MANVAASRGDWRQRRRRRRFHAFGAKLEAEIEILEGITRRAVQEAEYIGKPSPRGVSLLVWSDYFPNPGISPSHPSTSSATSTSADV